MAKVERWPLDNGEIRWAFQCPGCGTMHALHVEGGKPDAPRWTFNNDSEHPTFSPSVLVTWKRGDGGPDKVCHSYVRGGRIEYLGDCTHDMAGCTVDLPDIEAD